MYLLPVVLCALVLVICLLSVLYHRKQTQKHQVTIQPFLEEQESTIQQAQSDCRVTAERVDSISQKRNQSNKRLLSRLDQAVMESQIYQIYSTGIYQTRAMTCRAKSAGPVLSRADNFGRCPDADVEDPGVWTAKGPETHAGWKEQELEKLGGKESKEKDSDCGSKEKEERAGITEMENKLGHVERQDDTFFTNLKIGVKYEQNLNGEKNKPTLEENVQDQGFVQTEDLVQSEEESYSDDLCSSSARSQPSQEHVDGFQALGDVENMPYFTIGADPKNQSPNPEQKASTGQWNLRRIRRTLSWPPTAAQWKKQLAQTQQLLNVSPKLIFVTQYEYHIGMFPSGISSAIPENVPQASCSGFPKQQLQIKDHKHIKPFMEVADFGNQARIQDSSSFTGDYGEIEEGQSEMLKSYSPSNSEAKRSDLVTVKPRMSSQAATEVKMKSSQKKVINKTPKNGLTQGKSGRQPRRVERDGKKVVQDKQRDQSHSSSSAHPSGGSPSDDNLLVGNEYTFIDLLHEVVENHGRWTRERWRQSHMNKQKNKEVTKS